MLGILADEHEGSRQGAGGAARAHQADGRRGQGAQAARARQVDRARAARPLLRRRQVVRGRHPRHADGRSTAPTSRRPTRSSAATATSTGAWCARRPTTSRSRADRSGRPARSRSRACASWRCAIACRWCGSSTRRARASIRSRGRTAIMLSLFAGAGALFREEVIMSGVVPLVAAMVGPGAAGTAYIPGLADFVPMMKNIGSMALGGPPLVKAVTGQDITEQELGGTQGAHREVGRRRRRGRGRFGVHRGHQGVPVVLPVELRGEAADRRVQRSGRSARRAAARHPARVDAAVLRHVRDHQARRRLRAPPRHQAEVRPGHHHGPRAHRRPAVRHRRQQPAPDGRHPHQRLGRQGRALHSAVRRLQHPARVPDGRAGLHGRIEGRARGHHPPRRQDAARDGVGDGAEADRAWCARATAPATS